MTFKAMMTFSAILLVLWISAFVVSLSRSQDQVTSIKLVVEKCEVPVSMSVTVSTVFIDRSESLTVTCPQLKPADK